MPQNTERREIVIAGGQIVVSDQFICEPGAFIFDQWLVGFNEEARRVNVDSRCIFSICVDRIKSADYNENVIKAAANDDFGVFTAG